MPNGTDALVNVKYPEITLLNANYHLDGDDQNYQYGTDYFSAVPKDAKVIVQNAGKTPMVGCVGIFNKDDEAAAKTVRSNETGINSTSFLPYSWQYEIIYLPHVLIPPFMTSGDSEKGEQKSTFIMIR